MNTRFKKLLVWTIGVVFFLFAFTACLGKTKDEKLLIALKAERAVEVNSAFKPEVTVAEGGRYELSVTKAPKNAEIPTVTDNAFVPDRLGDYTYKIVVTKEGQEPEEQSGTVQAVDSTPPVVSGEVKKYTVKRGETLVFSEMVDNLSVSDSYDTTVAILRFKKIFKDETEVDLGQESAQFTFAQAGNYKVVFSAADGSANETLVTVAVTVAGFDVSDASDIELFVGDTLSIPGYTVLPEGAGTVKLFLDGEEISASNLPVFTQPGEHTLKLGYFIQGNDSSTPDETAEIAVKVKDIEIFYAIDAEGKEVGFTGKIPQAIVNDPNAEATLTLQKPGEAQGSAVTPSEPITYETNGYYIYVFSVTKGEIKRSATTEVYIREKNELLSFENARGGNAWDGLGATNTEIEPALSEEQAKYGKYSVKMVLPQGRNNELVYNTGMPVGKVYNTVSFWIYSSAATELRMGLAQNDSGNWWLLNPENSESFKVSVGWNQISLMIANTAGNGQIGTLRLTNIGAAEATVYVDGISFSSDNYILEKNAPKEFVKGSVVDLNNYFEVVGISETTQVEIRAEKGEISLREYTAPTQTGKDRVTIVVSEDGKTTRTLVIEFTIISVSFEVSDNYDFYYDMDEEISVRKPTQSGAVNPVIKVELVVGKERTEIEGNTFAVGTAGWVSIVYTLTCDNEPEPIVLVKEFYVREIGEVLTFEDYVGSGRTYENTAGSSAGIADPAIDDSFAKSGNNSMKFVLGCNQQAMLNYTTSEHAPKPETYNTIRLALHSDVETSVRIGIGQNGNPWWFIDPNSSAVYPVRPGWNEIVISIPEAKGSGAVACLALTNLGGEAAVFHLDSVRFLTEINVSGTNEPKQAISGSEIDLAKFVSVTDSDGYTLTVKVDGETLSGTKYTFAADGIYEISFTAKDNKSGVEKTYSFELVVKSISLSAAGYANSVLDAQITVHPCTVEGVAKNVTVKVIKPDGAESSVTEGGTFKADQGGWYRVTYMQPGANGETLTLEKTFYVGYENELMSFEEFARNGQGVANIGTSTSGVEISAEQAYFGKYSLKFTNLNQGDRAQTAYDGNPISGTAPVISDNAYNKIRLWVYSETEASVTIAIQGGGSDADWGWLTDTEAVTHLRAGWQEITFERNFLGESKYVASIFVDKKTEGTNGVAESVYIDCIRFVNE